MKMMGIRWASLLFVVNTALGAALRPAARRGGVRSESCDHKERGDVPGWLRIFRY